MRRIVAMTLCFLFLAASSWAGGKEVFVKRCGACHKSGGKAPPVNPADKAAVVWEKYFKRHRHPVDISSIGPSDMKTILQYLKDHAADSDQPVAAAIPK